MFQERRTAGILQGLVEVMDEELNRRISHIEQNTVQIEGRLSALETKSAVDVVHHGNVEKRLGGIEDTLKWLVRLIIGALVLAVIGFVVGGGLSNAI